MEYLNYTRGNPKARVLIVGEAWGVEEDRARLPFVGASGKELSKILYEAGLLETNCLFTNLVNAKPAFNDFTQFLLKNKDKASGFTLFGVHCSITLKEGLFRLETLIDKVKPELIIALGNWPLWALNPECVKLSTKQGYTVPSGIASWRGSELFTREINGKRYKLLPTLHPASILRSWADRRFMVHDIKARAVNLLNNNKPWGEKIFKAQVAPTYSECCAALFDWLNKVEQGPLELSVDIETSRRQFITNIGLGDQDGSICIPFYFINAQGASVDYFNLEQEIHIITLLKQLLEHPNLIIIGQNFNYDSTFLAIALGIQAKVTYDTMLMHHLCYPGTPKSLDMLASLYTANYVFWKDESKEASTDEGHIAGWLYNCKDTAYTLEIATELKKLITHFGLNDQYQCQLEQWHIARDMGLAGMRLDTELAKSFRMQLLEARRAFHDFLLNAMPEDIRFTPTNKPWYSSPAFASTIIYKLLGVPVVLHKKTKQPTLDASSFEPIKKRAPWLSSTIDAIDKIRSIDVFITHFLDVKLGADSRIRTAFNVGGTDTLRWSSNINPFGEGTNLQNIPKGDK